MIRTLTFAFLAAALPVQAQQFTRADTLRGSNGPARAWWDVTFYDLHVRVNPADSTISGWNGISYRVLEAASEMQIDLQEPLQVDSIIQDGRSLSYRREGAAFFVEMERTQRPGEENTVTVYYGGKPVSAQNPPWDGGLIWRKDSRGNDFVATANQSIGASVWWPMKDLMLDEPDSQRVAITVPDPMVNVSNGRLRRVTPNGDGTSTWEWFASSPINSYGISINAGSYAHWSDVFRGEDGLLTLDYWPLEENLLAAKSQWAQVPPMMRCFEHWFGPYPWYEDGFKLVETPHLGMEHQTAVAYGNGYRNGYRRGSVWVDLSGTGQGLSWDFIIIHEAAHEWWANNVTAQDVADLWVHESFANYAENLYIECATGSPENGAEYVIGTRGRIQNVAPIVGTYGVNSAGSGDMYYKGGNMLHMIRQLVDDDMAWRGILRGLNETFGRKTVTGAQVEAFISEQSGLELSAVFDQYLRTTMIPVLEYQLAGTSVRYRWTEAVAGFDMPIRVRATGDGWRWIQPTEEWQLLEVGQAVEFGVDDDFYVLLVEVER